MNEKKFMPKKKQEEQAKRNIPISTANKRFKNKNEGPTATKFNDIRQQL